MRNQILLMFRNTQNMERRLKVVNIRRSKLLMFTNLSRSSKNYLRSLNGAPGNCYKKIFR